MRMAWGWRLPRRRACRYRGAAHGGAWRLLSAKVPRALRARVLAAQRNWTTAPLPDWLVTGVAPTSAAAWERSLARSRIGPTSARTWARLIWPMRGSGCRTVALGCLPRAAVRARSRSARLPSRLRSSRGWMRVAVPPDRGMGLVARDRGGPQPVKQLGWGAPAAVAVAAQKGGQAG